MAEVTINAELFFERLAGLEAHLAEHKTEIWGGCDSICVPLGSALGEASYSKMSSVHLHLLGYEFPDSVMVITKKNFYFMATAKKCQYLRDSLMELSGVEGRSTVHLLEKTKDEGMVRQNMNDLLNAMREKNGKKVGSLFKADHPGKFIPAWMEMLKDSQLETYEISPALGDYFSVKDAMALVRTRCLIFNFGIFICASSPLPAATLTQFPPDNRKTARRPLLFPTK
jgi:nucleosome binding factor SPN SPT16 subunit